MRIKKSLFFSAIVILALNLISTADAGMPLIQYINPVSAQCIRVVEGDAIIVNIAGVKERVQLIGIAIPETKHSQEPVQYSGVEAYGFTKKMIEGKKVILKFDKNQRDKYKRLLAYVYLDDGTFVNAEIIKQGYGNTSTELPFIYMEQFREYEKEARKGRKGLWK